MQHNLTFLNYYNLATVLLYRLKQLIIYTKNGVDKQLSIE